MAADLTANDAEALMAEAQQLHELLTVSMEPTGNQPPSVEELMVRIAGKKARRELTAHERREIEFAANIAAFVEEHDLTDEEVEELRANFFA